MGDEQKKPFPAVLADLKAEPVWLCWKWVDNPKKPGKRDKPPIQPKHPERLASIRNPKHWTDFKTAIAAKRAGKADGVGPVLSGDAKRVWVDFDGCVDPKTRKINEHVMALIERANSYAEFTPSGEGVRLILRPSERMKKRSIHRKFRTATMKGEIFFRTFRYVTVTGDRVPGTPDALSEGDEIVSAILTEADGGRPGQGENTDYIVDDEADELTTLDMSRPLGYSAEQIRTLLNNLPPDNATDPATGAPWWDRDKWLTVLFAVHDDTDGSEAGFALVDEWCSKSSYYDPEGLRKTWDSARGSNVGQARTTLRVLVKWSNDWTRPQREESILDIRAEMASVQTIQGLGDLAEKARDIRVESPLLRASLVAAYRTAAKRLGSPISEAKAMAACAYRDPDLERMPGWLRPFVFVAGGTGAKAGFFYDSHLNLAYTPNEFNSVFARKFMSQEEVAQGATHPANPPSELALVRYQIPQVADLGYRPFKETTDDEDGLDDDANTVETVGGVKLRRPRIYTYDLRTYLNTYHTRDAVPAVFGPYTKEQKDDIRTIVALYTRVCGGNKRDRDIFLSTLKYILLERKRVPFMLALCSAEGSGKTTAGVRIPQLLFGRSNVGVYPPSALFDQSDQSWQFGHLWKVIEELFAPDRAKQIVMERLKPVITNEVVSPRVMYKGFSMAENTATYIGLTNHDNVLAITRADTRIYPIFPTQLVATEAQMKETLAADPDFYRRVDAAIRRNIGCFRGWLEREFQYHPDFRAANGRAPASERKLEIADEGMDPLMQDILDVLREEKVPLLTVDVVCLKSLIGVLHQRNTQINTEGGRKRASEVVSTVLRANGYKQFARLRLPENLMTPDDTDLDAVEGDNRTRIYTRGVGALAGKPATQEAVAAYCREWLDDL